MVLSWSNSRIQARLIWDTSEQWAILLRFLPDATTAEIENAGEELVQMLQDIVRPIEVPLRVGMGRCKQTLTQLRISFDEAEQSLHQGGDQHENPSPYVSAGEGLKCGWRKLQMR